MTPLVDELFQYSRVRMLWYEARAEHLYSLACNLLYQRRVVEKPPAAERHQVAELSGGDTKLVLVRPRQEGRQKTNVRIFGAHSLDRHHFSLAHAVTRLSKRRVH